MNDIEEKENNNKTEFVFSSDDNIETIDFNDFDIKGIIGRGNLCKVFLSTCKKNKVLSNVQKIYNPKYDLIYKRIPNVIFSYPKTIKKIKYNKSNKN